MSKTQTTAVVPAAETSVEEKPSPAILAERKQDEMRPTILVVDDDTRAAIIKEASQAEAVVAFLVEKGNVAGLEMLNAQVRFRRLFPATEKVRAILGDDACDLVGATDAYRDAMKGVNAEAMRALVSRLRRDGYGKDIAEATAKSRMETVRKTVSLHQRRYVETVALNACDGDETAAAALLLAHGFNHNTAIETKAKPQLIRPNQTVEVTEEEGEGVRSVNGRLLKVVTPAPPAEDKKPEDKRERATDQTQPADTADAQIKRLLDAAGITVADPHAIINLAIGLLDGARELLANGAPMNKTVRKSLRAQVTSAQRKLVGQLEETLDVAEVAAKA